MDRHGASGAAEAGILCSAPSSTSAEVDPSSESVMIRSMNAHTILWIYIILMVLGGVMGFVKAKSKVSLIASVTFASADK